MKVQFFLQGLLPPTASAHRADVPDSVLTFILTHQAFVLVLLLSLPQFKDTEAQRA